MARWATRRHAALATVALALITWTAGVTITAVPAGAAPPTASEAAADAQLIFELINNKRVYHGLAPLTWSSRLASAAHSHNLKEAGQNTLSHQLAGELSLGARIAATGYQWMAIGENIGCTQDWSQSGLLALHKVFYNEIAPNDIHRRNILSRTFRNVGVDVYIDAAHHTAWLTEDFAAPL